MANFDGSLTVQVEQSANVNVVLVPASTSTAISVVDVTPLVTNDNAALGHTLEARRIEEIPINGRNVVSLLESVPGMQSDSGGALRTFGEGPATHDITLDGAPLTDMAYGEGTVNRPPGLESIQEFRVDVNATSARSPRPTDIVMVTKSGTNSLHGSLFETNRDNGYGVARAIGDSNTPGKLIRNEYGGSVGGPLIIPKVYNGKDKTFWFFSTEFLKLRSGATGQWKVPTEANRNGDYTNDVNSAGILQKIYNPFTTDPTTFSRQQFAYGGVPNVIDPSLESPLYKYMASVIPKPNRPGVNPFLAPNYFGPKPNANDQSTYTSRVDQKFGNNDMLYGRVTVSTFQHNYTSGNGVPTLDQLGNFRRDNSPNKSLALNWAHSFSPSFFNELSVSGTRSINTTGEAGSPTTDYASILGLPNPNGQPGFPVIGDIGFSNGSNYLSPATVRGEFFNYFILEDNATKIVGKHEIQFGLHLRYDQLTYLPQQQRAAGAVSFPGGATALYDPINFPDRSSGASNTGSVAASAFIGASSYNYRLVKGKFYMHHKEDAGYVQDNYKLSQRLTLNLGVRWDFNPFPTDKYGVLSSWDQKNQAIALGAALPYLYKVGATSPGYISALQGLGVKFETLSQAGLPSGFAKNNWHDIGPHVGFAYRALDGRKAFVIRGGYAINYYPLPLWGWNDTMKNNTPWTVNLDNNYLSASAESPDGIQNYSLVGVPTIIAGKNSKNAIDPNNVAPTNLLNNGSINTSFFDPNEPSARVHTWNLTVEKEVAANMLVRVSYQGNHGSDLDMYQDLNQQLTTYGNYNWYKRTGTEVPGGLYGDQEVRPLGIVGGNPTSPYSDIHQFGRYGWSNSNGGTVELERRLTKGIGFQVFYQLVNAFRAGGYGWESGIDSVTAWPAGEVPSDLHARIKELYYSRDTSVPKQEVRYNWTAELPVGRGKLLGHNMPRVLDAVIGGWQLTGMGRMHSNSINLINPANGAANNYPTGAKVQYYGHKYPIQDCRSGECQAGYLLWNAYIPAFQINQPGGIMGVPANYQPASSPVNPYPSTAPSPSDPKYDLYGTNLVNVTLSNGSVVQTAKADVNPFTGQVLQTSWLFSTDASLSKSFTFTEHTKLRVQADFFNVFNQPGVEFDPNNPNTSALNDGTGIVLKSYSMNSPRTIQLSARFTW
jgi:hypothetical protein